MIITPRLIAAAYELIRRADVMSSWTLPESAAVKFSVTAHSDQHADYESGHIRVSRRAVGKLDTLLTVVAHEALHMAQDLDGTATKGVEHNANWRSRWRQACKRHGWDWKAFGPAE